MDIRGSVYFVILMLFVLFVFFAVGIAPALIQFSGEARTNLDCSNTSISYYDKSSCLLIDVIPPYFVGVILALGGALLGLKYLYNE